MWLASVLASVPAVFVRRLERLVREMPNPDRVRADGVAKGVSPEGALQGRRR
jgi:hypothetical protein